MQWLSKPAAGACLAIDDAKRLVKRLETEVVLKMFHLIEDCASKDHAVVV